MAKFNSILDRVMSHVSPEPNSGCWLWTGACDRGGYSSIGNGKGGTTSGHLLMYRLLVGEVPAGLELDHKCRVRCCVNPQHLEPVTRLENVRRGNAGKAMKARTHCAYGHPYDELNVRPRRDCGGRCCRSCEREKCIRLRRAKGVRERSLTHCYRGHEFTPENTKTRLHKDGRTQRLCAVCDRERQLLYAERLAKRGHNLGPA